MVAQEVEQEHEEPGTPGLVTIAWLQRAFRLSDGVTRKRLHAAGCKPVKRVSKGNLYDFVEAASCLVEPRIDIETIIATAGPEILPPKLSNAYWSAQERRVKFEERTGKLWRTEDVYATIQDIAVLVQGHISQWPDQLQALAGLSDEERKLREAQVDNLLNEIRSEVKERTEKQSTPHELGRFRAETEDELYFDDDTEETPVNLAELF